MQYVPLSDIIIPQNRQRSKIDPEALGELAESIQSIGLLHPPVVRDEAGKVVLVAGERRLAAIKLIYLAGKSIQYGGQEAPPGTVPVNFLGELSEEQAVEAELEENIRRVDISVLDRAKAIARLHELRQRQAQAEGRVQTLAQTAEEAFGKDIDAEGRGKVAVWNALTIAKASEQMPELANVKSEREAMKLITRAREREQHQRMATLMGRQSTTDMHKVYHADCLDFLASYEGEPFDCIIIDPPYGVGADDFGDGAGRLGGITHEYEDTPESFKRLMEAVAGPLTRVTKPASHLYCWCDIDGFHFLRDLFRQHGWYVFRTPLINIKREGGRVPLPEHGPRRAYEMCLYAFRGKKPVTAIYPDVFESTLHEGNFGHGAQKPVEAYVNLLKRSCRPGDLVLDCFAGTGTILAAAHELKLRSVAVEKDAGSYGICLKRLEGLQ